MRVQGIIWKERMESIWKNKEIMVEDQVSVGKGRGVYEKGESV